MRKIIFLLLGLILLTSIVSAEMIISQQPQELYSSGEVLSIPVKITTLNGINGFLIMDMICNGFETEIHKEYIVLTAGEEREISTSIPLITTFLGRPAGSCVVKASIGEEYILTNEFTISNTITIELKSEEREFAPEGNIVVEGDAKKDSGEYVNGFVELKLTSESGNIDLIDTVQNGYFFINFSLPKETAAGKYSAQLSIYEKDYEGVITNHGFISYGITITQVPTSLEIMFENSEVEPGTNLQVKGIVHDQTGIEIGSTVILTIKNEKDESLEQIEKATDELLEFPIEYNEPAAEWKVTAVSNQLTSEATFKIIEKEEVNVELVNKTLTIKNIGNVPYNKSVLVKIGEETISVDVELGVDEEEKYILTAPDGEYEVEILTNEGEQISGSVMLTGKAIDVRKVSQGVIAVAKHPISWIFMIIVLAGIAFMVFRKGYKKSFFGKMHFKKKDTIGKITPKEESVINSNSKAELSLSIKGDKQNASLICLKIKNLETLDSKKGNAKETIQKIVHLAEKEKAAIYKNQDNLFFILAPTKTKTFKNERPALELAVIIKKEIEQHNKKFKQKIDYGISLNNGAVIAKQEKEIMKFMSMGTLITTAKKIAGISKGEILLGEKIRDKLIRNTRTQKHTHGKTNYYSIKEIKHWKTNKKFISEFIKRLEKKK